MAPCRGRRAGGRIPSLSESGEQGSGLEEFSEPGRPEKSPFQKSAGSEGSSNHPGFETQEEPEKGLQPVPTQPAGKVHHLFLGVRGGDHPKGIMA